jgi:hypothetical protein
MGIRRFRHIAGISNDEEWAGWSHDGKPVYRIVLDFGPLPNAQARDMAHGITDLDEVVMIEGVARDTSTGETIAIGD